MGKEPNRPIPTQQDGRLIMTKSFIKTLFTLAILSILASGGWAGSKPGVRGQESILDPSPKSIEAPTFLDKDKTLTEPFRYNENLTPEENGFAALKMGDFQAAKEILSQALQKNPQNVGVLLALAQIAVHHREPTKIENYLKKAMEVEPANGEILETFAHFLTSQNRLREAKETFTKGAQQNPSDPKPYFHLGRLHMETKHYAEAQQAFESALKIDNSLILGHLGVGDSLAFRGKYSEALNSYSALLDLNPKFVAAYIRIGQAHEGLADMELAEIAYRVAINLDPKQGIALNNLSWILAEKKESLDEALVWAKKAVSLTPKVSSVYDTLGWVYRARGELDKAHATFMKGTTIPPLDPSLMYHLGIVLTEQGKTSDATMAFKNALELAPNFPNAKDAKSRLAQLEKP